MASERDAVLLLVRRRDLLDFVLVVRADDAAHGLVVDLFGQRRLELRRIPLAWPAGSAVGALLIGPEYCFEMSRRSEVS